MGTVLDLPFVLAATPPADGGAGFFATTIQDPTFWVAVAFLIFVALIVWKARGAITGGLDARGAKIQTEIDEAKRLREEAQQLLADYKRKQRDAIAEAEAMLKAAGEEAGRVRTRAAADLERREQQAIDRIAQAEKNAEAQVRNIAADLAIAATRRILTEKMDGATANRLIDDTIRDLPSKLN
jgi:F-type H+-transporting ATPase subunit b